MQTKICSKCKEEKEVCEFYTDKSKINGYYSSCKECKIIYTKTRVNENKTYLKLWKISNPDYHKKFREKNPNYVKKYYQNNKEVIIERVKKHYHENKEKNSEKFRTLSTKYYYNNREKRLEYNKKYNNINREKRNEFLKTKKINNPIYRLSHNVRGRIYTFLKNNNIIKQNKTFDIVGCSPEFLKEHLENQFTEGMSWDLMGKYIHIDHIIPLSSAKTEDEVYGLCHYTNLQPLWAEDNLRKSNKILL
jgi:hypothetical protein